MGNFVFRIIAVRENRNHHLSQALRTGLSGILLESVFAIWNRLAIEMLRLENRFPDRTSCLFFGFSGLAV